MLYPDTDRLDWILLAPPFADSPHSSLGFMLDDLCAATQGQATWAVLDGRVDVDAISRALYCANQRQMPIIMAGASFAFVHLLEALQGRNLALGQRGRVMQTGGFKGKSKEVEALALRAGVNGLAYPHPDTVRLAATLGLEATFRESCCTLVAGR